jgi:hypothetical protein
MRIPTWRLAVTGGAVITLAVVGIGLVAAANVPPSTMTNPVSAEATRLPGASGRADRRSGQERLRERRAGWGPRLLRIGRHLVHVEATVTDRDGQLVTLWLDHGTVQSVGDGFITISEAGGKTEKLMIDDKTTVHVGREDGTLADVTVGDEVFVKSRVEDGTALARRILIIPPRPA